VISGGKKQKKADRKDNRKEERKEDGKKEKKEGTTLSADTTCSATI
jgi:hypothetical protein